MTPSQAQTNAQPRSLLFVPAHEERKLHKAIGSGADALILDLEDSVAPDAKADARKLAADFLARRAENGVQPMIYVRVNDLASGMTQTDLSAILPHMPDGIMLPKANSGEDVAACAALIEQLGGTAADHIRIIAIATETPLAILQMASFSGCHPRLEGLAWGAEDLSAEIGATATRDRSGVFTTPVMLARNLCLFGAHAAGAQPIDAIYADFRDEDGLRREAEEAAIDGFTGKMAIHPAQIPIINQAFTPGKEAIAEAKEIVAAFAAQPGAGAIGLHGRMVDRPHLLRASRLLARVPVTEL